MLAYFGEKRHACQAHLELPCDFCQNRKLVTSQLNQLTAVQQAKAMADASKQQSPTDATPVKAVWKKSAAPHSDESKLPLTDASPPSTAPVRQTCHVLQPLHQISQQAADSEAVSVSDQPCKHAGTGSPKQRGTASAGVLAPLDSKKIVKPVIKRAKYNAAFKPPRRACAGAI